jgi:hypothetical protein
MPLWSVKFDHENGETRRCKICDKDFHATRPVWRCKVCTAKVNFEAAKNKYGEGIMPTGKWAGLPPKKPYPFDTKTHVASKRFCKIRTELSNAWKEYRKTGDKTAVRQHYDKYLNEIRENGILEWIIDRRGNGDTINDEPMLKSKKQISEMYPDTRNWHED